MHASNQAVRRMQKECSKCRVNGTKTICDGQRKESAAAVDLHGAQHLSPLNTLILKATLNQCDASFYVEFHFNVK